MSTCISRKGEFSDHETLDDQFCCVDCGAFDEQAVIAFHAGPIRRVEALLNRWETVPALRRGTAAVEVRKALKGAQS